MIRRNKHIINNYKKYEPYSPNIPIADKICSNDNFEYFAESQEGCMRKTYQKAKLHVPIAVRPYSRTGPAKTAFYGKPELKKVKCFNPAFDGDCRDNNLTINHYL